MRKPKQTFYVVIAADPRADGPAGEIVISPTRAYLPNAVKAARDLAFGFETVTIVKVGEGR